MQGAMRVLMIILAASALFVAGCPVPVTPNTPVPYRYETDPVTGRGFFVYVPSTYSHARPTPLIISCHGSPPFDVAEHHIREWKWYGEQYGCIIVAPSLVGTDPTRSSEEHS